MRVLHVEEQQRDAKLTRQRLRRAGPGFDLVAAATLAEAAAWLDASEGPLPDLVLTTVRLPDGDGLSLIRRVREGSLPVAVVVITAAGDQQAALAALEAGADDYFARGPESLERLPQALEAALERHHAEESRRARPLRVLYAEHRTLDVDLTRQHLARHAPHIRLDALQSASAVWGALPPRGTAGAHDVILLECHLPGLDVLEVLWAHCQARASAAPVVLLTRPGDEEVAVRALRLGADGCLAKSPGYLNQLPGELEKAYYRAELRRRQAELGESEARNRAVLRALPDLVFVQTRDGVYVDYHARDAGALLVPPAEFLGRRTRDVLPPELAASAERSFAEALASDEPSVLEYSLTIDGQERRYEARTVACEHDRVLSVVRDVSDRWRAHQAQAESEALFRRLAETTPATISISTEGRLLYVNPAVEALTGRSREELLAMDPWEMIHPEMREGLRERFGGLGESGYLPAYEVRVLTKSGQERWAYCMTTPIAFRGQPSLLTTAFDITERRQAEEALREARRTLQGIADTLPSVLRVHDLVERRNVYANAYVSVVLGYTPRELQEMGESLLARLMHPDDLARWPTQLARYEEAADGQVIESEYRMRHRNGEFRWLHCREIVFERTADGQPRLILGAAQDITERKRADRQIQDLAGRLIAAQEEERKRISRELHDDLNQKVAALGITVSAVKRRLPETARGLREQVAELQARVGELAEDIRRLSHELHPATLDHVGLVAGLRSYCHEFGRSHGIEVTLSVQDEWPAAPPHVELCLYRVAQESLHNTARHSGARQVRVALERNGDAVRLSVSEHGGRGFDVKQARERGGLGLSSMEERVRLLGGRLRVSSRRHRGTAVQAEIPLGGREPEPNLPR